MGFSKERSQKRKQKRQRRVVETSLVGPKTSREGLKEHHSVKVVGRVFRGIDQCLKTLGTSALIKEFGFILSMMGNQ